MSVSAQEYLGLKTGWIHSKHPSLNISRFKVLTEGGAQWSDREIQILLCSNGVFTQAMKDTDNYMESLQCMTMVLVRDNPFTTATSDYVKEP